MLFKQLYRDFQRNRVVTAALFIFVMLAALLVSSAANTIVELFSSLDSLFMQAKVPHFVQMHLGELDQNEIASFAAGNGLVSEQQTVEMIGVHGSNLFLGDSQTSEENSVMDISFVQQNESFDLLLNLANEVIQVADGEIAVPVYFMQQREMQIGDRVRIDNGAFSMEFKVIDFVRDAQMNPSIVTSKRFVISDFDFAALKANFGEIEYLIEFLLTDVGRVSEFGNAYQAANLPQGGPTINYNLLRTMNALTDGMVVMVTIMVSLLLIAIAMLCLRFTIIATMEEDYKQIGIMKALGINSRDIRGLYMSKYVLMAASAAASGYIASLLVNRVLTANITLYMGAASKSVLHYLVPIMAATTVMLAIIIFCWLVLGRFRRVSAVQALRSGETGERHMGKHLVTLGAGGFQNVNVSLGLQDVIVRRKVFAVLCCVFVICSFIIIVPVNLLNTIQSPEFTTYMGVGRSDIRIDLQQLDRIEQRFEQLVEYVAGDHDVQQFAPLVTSRFRVLGNAGAYETINVETGDFSIFPLTYLTGAAPVSESEIALSYLSANELGKDAGDTIQMLVAGCERQMFVSGIYQDVTNGGRTAKALLPYDADHVLWYVVNLDLRPGIDIRAKIDEYSAAFHPAKVTHLQDYVSQTFGATIRQLQMITALSIAIATAISVLITSLFLKMLIAKDHSAIATMKSIGFSLADIRVQYVTRALVVLGMGIVIGTLASNTLGQGLVSLMGSAMGASRIKFVINPVAAYILCPLTLMTVVAITALASIAQINRSSIAATIGE